MAHIDHHIKPYDEGTLMKLDIFEKYVEAWLPTFIMQKNITKVNIVDFFSGPGYDRNGIAGSPIRILEKINSFYDYLTSFPTEINLYFNEYKTGKFIKLQNNCNKYLEANKRLLKFVNIYFSNKDFNDIYKEITSNTINEINLYIIDQSGIRFTNKENFNTLLALKKTDFLFFISSSFFKRFNKEEEFVKHLDIKEDDLKQNPYNFIHRIILERYRSLIPENSRLKIYPFSIKKKANIYGIIFGSNHIRGVEKFLQIAWDKNKINGEANYDIDDDKVKKQLVINFENPTENKKLTKIESFQKKLEEYIKNKKEVTNIDLYHFTIINGHILKHTTEHLKELKKLKKIEYSGHMRINWDNVKAKNIVTFKWI